MHKCGCVHVEASINDVSIQCSARLLKSVLTLSEIAVAISM